MTASTHAKQTLADNPGTASDFSESMARGYAEHLEFSIDVGLVDRVRIAYDILIGSKFADADFVRPVLLKTVQWLPAAEDHERKHGEGSRFEREHPKVIQLLEPRVVRESGHV